jgi:hypothetical protein
MVILALIFLLIMHVKQSDGRGVLCTIAIGTEVGGGALE